MVVVTPSTSNKKPPLAPVFLSLRLLKCAHQEENAWVLKPLSQSWPVPSATCRGLCRKCIPLPSVFQNSLHFSADSSTPRTTLKPSLRLHSNGSGSCVSLLQDYSLLPLRSKLPQPFPGPFHTLHPSVTFLLDIQSTLLQLFKETRGALWFLLHMCTSLYRRKLEVPPGMILSIS